MMRTITWYVPERKYKVVGASPSSPNGVTLTKDDGVDFDKIFQHLYLPMT